MCTIAASGELSRKVIRRFGRTRRRANVMRDAKNIEALVRSGWRTMTVWECELKSGQHVVEDRLRDFLTEP